MHPVKILISFFLGEKTFVFILILLYKREESAFSESYLGGLCLLAAQSKNIFRPADLLLLQSNEHIIENASANTDITKAGWRSWRVRCRGGLFTLMAQRDATLCAPLEGSKKKGI